MPDRKFSEPDHDFLSDSPLSERLRDEALRDRPAFSLSLHARIVQAVQAAPSPSRRFTERFWWFWTMPERRDLLLLSTGALAAALWIALTAWWLASDHGGTTDSAAPVASGNRQIARGSNDVPAPPPMSPPEVLEAASSLPNVAIRQFQNTLAQVDAQKWAYLDHDATVAKLLLESPFPTGLAATVPPQ